MAELNNLNVAIIDYGMGNLFSVKQSCKYIGLNPIITADNNEIKSSDALILPGVGAFGDAMENLRQLDLINPIKEFISTGKPFMGICLGMQLLLTESEEFGTHKGLDIIKGKVVKFNNNVKVPHVGWNQIFLPKKAEKNYWDNTPLKNLNNGEYMYFVHSYYSVLSDEQSILSVTYYADIEYCSSLLKGNIFAFQFHPEKSAHEGIKVYENWASIIRNKRSKL